MPGRIPGRIGSRISPDLRTLIGRGRHVAGPARGPLPTPGAPDDTRRGRRAARPAARPAARHVLASSPTAVTGFWRSATLRLASLTTAVAVASAAGTLAAVHSAAETPHQRPSYRPASTVAGWVNDATLGRTDSADQYAEATVSGLRDSRYGAGFRLRYADRTSQVFVTVSGTGWSIQPSGSPVMSGTFAHASSGTFRAEIQGRTVRVRWNGTVVASRTVTGTFRGRHVVDAVRQPTVSVALRNIKASSLPTSTTVAAPVTLPPASGGTWWSGASGDEAADGRYASWRGSALGVGGVWTDTYEAVTDQWAICEGPWSTWNKPLDLAVGAIYRSRGETWAAAASGAYTDRWTTALAKIKTCWGKRSPDLLYLRFAHEMNLASIPWSVRKGEETQFVTAMKLFSDLRYRIIPGAHLVFCPNDGTDPSLGGLDVRTLWPGKDSTGRPVADVFGVDSYNAWPHATTAGSFATKINATYPGGAPLGIERYRQLAASLGVPFAIPEWSNDGDPASAGGGGEAPEYVRQFNAWARAHAADPARPAPGQLLYEVHFNLWTQYQFWPSSIQPATASAYRTLTWGR